MFKYILPLLFSLNAFAQTNIPNIEAKIVNGQLGFTNLVINPSCKRNVANITGSSVAAVKNTTSALDGISDCTWNPTAASQTLTWAVDSLPAGLKGQNCEARINYLGDASLVTAQVQINSVGVASAVTLTNSGTNAAVASINYPCGDGSTATTIVLTSTGDAANVQYSVYNGPATNIGTVSQANLIGTADMVGASGCIFSENTSSGSTNFVDLGTGTGCNSFTVTGSVSQTAANDSRVTVTNMPPGDYIVMLAANYEYSGGVQNCYTRISDGTNTSDVQWSVVSGIGYGHGTFAYKMSYTTAGTRTFKVQAADDSTFSCRINANGQGADLGWRFYRFPTASQIAVTPNLTPAFWSGYHDNTCSWSVTSSTYAAFTADASCALTQRTASNISCTTNGSVLPAITCTLPRAGSYYICANGQYYNGTGSQAGGVRLWDGTTTISEVGSNSITADGKPLCGIYTATSTSVTFTLQGRANSGSENISSSGTNGNQTAIEWSIFAIGQNMPAPILVGSVTSNSTGAERTERVRTTNTACTSTPCAIQDQSGSWVSSISRTSTGLYTVNINSGFFSSAPTCLCTPGPTTNGGCQRQVATTTTAFNFQTVNGTGTVTDNSFEVVCMGPR